MPPMQHLLWPALGFAVALIAVLALRWAVMTVFNRWATGPGALAAFLQAIRLPSLLWCGVMAFYVTIEVASEADVLPRRLTGELTTILQASIILSVTITLAGMVETLITRVGESRAFGVPVTGLARAASRLTILAVGFLVLLSALGIHIAPILTALGVGGLAVLGIRVSVDYDSDPDRVEAVLVDEATRAAPDVPGLLDDPRPIARLIPGFGESSLDFTLVCQVASFVDQYPVQHELRKRIQRRLRAERIGMPFPTRTVELRGAGGGSGHARALADRGEHGERDQHEAG